MSKFKVGDRVLVEAEVFIVGTDSLQGLYGLRIGDHELGFVGVREEFMSPAPTPSPTGKTVKVRAAVCIADDGRWVVVGYSTDKDDAAMISAAHEFVPLDDAGEYPDIDAVHFIEAEVPVPEPQTIPGKVDEVTR